MRHSKNREEQLKLVFASLFAALVCVFSMMLQIPTPTMGYINLGDVAVLLAGFLLGPVYGFFAAAIGSSFADMLGGYVLYLPATFLIKGLAACLASYLSSRLARKTKSHAAAIYGISGAVSELWMIFAYYLYEASVCGYGWMTAMLGIPANLFQGAVGVFGGALLMCLLRKTGAMAHFFEKHGI